MQEMEVLQRFLTFKQVFNNKHKSFKYNFPFKGHVTG